MWEHIRLAEIGRIRDFVASKQMEFVILTLSLLAGSMAYLVSSIDPALDPLFIALIAGITLGGLLSAEAKEASQRVIGLMLPISISLYGSNIVMPNVGNFDTETLLATLFFAFILFSSVYLFSTRLGVSKRMAVLLSCGSGICGVSAIAIVSPLVRPGKEEFSASIIVITVVGLTGAITYPCLAKIFGLGSYHLLSGATLPQTGIVKISSVIFGEDMLEKALSVKAVRIALIAVVAIVISFVYSERKFYVPWYIVAFIAVALFSTSYLPHEVVEPLRAVSTVLFASSLASIGLIVDINKVHRVGLRPLAAVYAGWLVGLATFLALYGGGLL